MEEIYSYFLKKEKENGDILIKDFLLIFVTSMLKVNFLGGGRDGGDSTLYKFYFYMILKNKIGKLICSKFNNQIAILVII